MWHGHYWLNFAYIISRKIKNALLEQLSLLIHSIYFVDVHIVAVNPITARGDHIELNPLHTGGVIKILLSFQRGSTFGYNKVYFPYDLESVQI